MAEALKHQVRVYLDEAMAQLVRQDPADPVLRPLFEVMARHDGVLVSQHDAFAEYAAGMEAEGRTDDPLYRWTRATLDDPAKAAAHAVVFAVRVHGEELYGQDAADALEAALQPMVGGGVVQRLSRHDTDPAKTMPVPAAYR